MTEAPMDSATFRRHLLRLCWVPVLALLLLCLLLGYELDRISTAAHWVDHSDRVIAQINSVSRAITTRKSVVRGYLLTREPHYLELYAQNDTEIMSGFDKLRRLVEDNAAQTATEAQWRKDYLAWDAQDPRSVPKSDHAALLAFVQTQRALLRHAFTDRDAMLHREMRLRERRAVVLERLDLMSVAAFLFLAIVVGAVIVWRMTKTFHLIQRGYDERVAEIEGLYQESSARRQWLDTTLRSIGDAVIACDAEGRVAFMNLLAEKLTAWSEEEARGMQLGRVFNIINENTRLTVENPVDKVRQLGAVVGLANHTLLIDRNGTETPIDDSAAPIKSADQKLIGVVLVFRDITTKKATEAALIRAEKLASAGRMSASIAHEINNPLEALMNLMFLARQMEDIVEVREYLAQAESQLRRISHIARQSLGFYRDSSARALFSIRSVVEQVVEFYAARAALHGVRLEAVIASDLNLFGSADEIMQVLSNLLANSLDAMTSGGAIRILLRAASSSSDGADEPGKDDRGIVLYISDTGSGISTNHLAQIFDPFYTTKGSTSTGLGLWVTQQLVEKHGGSIQIRSRTRGPWRGTLFRIFLPHNSSSSGAV